MVVIGESCLQRVLCRVAASVLFLCMALLASQTASQKSPQTVSLAMPAKGLSSASVYVAIEPPFITNYGQARRLHYLKAGVSLRVKGSAGELAVFQHMPQIRDCLLRVFAAQTVQGLASAEGREMLRQQARQSLRQMLYREAGEDYLQDVLFSSLVMQP